MENTSTIYELSRSTYDPQKMSRTVQNNLIAFVPAFILLVKALFGVDVGEAELLSIISAIALLVQLGYNIILYFKTKKTLTDRLPEPVVITENPADTRVQQDQSDDTLSSISSSDDTHQS